MRYIALLILLSLAAMNLAPSVAQAACTSPAAAAGGLEFFTTQSCSLSNGSRCNQSGGQLGFSIQFNAPACDTFCEGVSGTTCCEWDNVTFSCYARSDTGTAAGSGSINDGGLCSVLSSSYKLCDGTNWQTISLDGTSSGTCSGLADIQYDTTTKTYKVCDGTNYKPINCTTGSAPTADVTAKGTANNKTAIAQWTAISGVTLNAGDTLLVCAASKDEMFSDGWKQVSAGGSHTCGIKSDDTLRCWGYNQYGQIGDNTSGISRHVPTPVDGGGTWKQVSAGGIYTCGIKSDDSLWCWGEDSINGKVPAQVSGGGTWKTVSVGGSGGGTSGGGHVCGIKSDNTLWCWRRNDAGQIGDNTQTDRSAPTAVNGGGTWKAVAAGVFHSCGIKSDDTLWCWGNNGGGQLGDNSTTQRLVPTVVSGGGAWKTLAVGDIHTCGIKSDDTLWCWGSNDHGQLGDNTAFTNRLVPTAVSGGGTWKTVTADGEYTGGPHTCGIKSDDTLWCWGSNDHGQLGDNTAFTNRLVPTAVSGGGTWNDVSAGGAFSNNAYTCGIKSDYTLRCWGDNAEGQLGDGTGTDRLIPTSSNPAVTWKGLPLTLNVSATTASKGTTSLYSLVDSPAGTGDIVAEFDIQSATGKALTASSITNLKTASALDKTAGAIGSSTAPSSGNTATTTQADEFLFGCIGTNGAVGDAPGTWSNSFTNGQRDGSTGGSATTNMTANNGYRQVSATGTYAAAKTGEANRNWEAAIATFRVATTCTTYGACPKAASRQYVAANGMRWCSATASTWKALGAGGFHTCGIKSDNSLKCWGSTMYSQAPIDDAGPWEQVSAGGYHSCGIKSDDTLHCWGRNGSGQVGDGSTTERAAPTAVSGGGAWKQVATGEYHSCGIKSDDTLHCWGSNSHGQIGDNTSGTNRLVPTAINGGGTWKQVSAGGDHSCGIKSDDTLHCWGSNSHGQIGDNTFGSINLVPTTITGGGTWKQVSAGSLHTCGIKSDNTLWCWGDGSYGQLGDNSQTFRLVPTAVSGGGTWKFVDSGNYDYGHTCAIKFDDTLWCWGYGSYGQLGEGNGNWTARTVPTAVYGDLTWKKMAAGGLHSCGIGSDDSMKCWGYNVNGQVITGGGPYNIPKAVSDNGIWMQFKAP